MLFFKKDKIIEHSIKLLTPLKTNKKEIDFNPNSSQNGTKKALDFKCLFCTIRNKFYLARTSFSIND